MTPIKTLMSRQTKFILKFKGGLQMLVRLNKSIEEKTSFIQTYEGRQVRTVKVLTNDDVKPTSLEDIEQVVPWGDVESSYVYRNEEGEEKIIDIDKTVIQNLFPKSDTMKVISIIDSTEISPRMYSGDHYHLSIQEDSKTKSTAKIDRQGYGLIYHVLGEYDKMLLVSFMSANREKFAVIYKENTILMCSILLHETYQREAPIVVFEKIKAPEAPSKKLIDVFGGELDKKELNDRFEDQMIEYLTQLKEEVQDTTTGKKPKPKPRVNVKHDPDNFLDILASL